MAIVNLVPGSGFADAEAQGLVPGFGYLDYVAPPSGASLFVPGSGFATVSDYSNVYIPGAGFVNYNPIVEAAKIYAPRRKVWSSQPQQQVEIDWSNPLTKGLVEFYLPISPIPASLVNKAIPTATGSISYLPLIDGTGLSFASGGNGLAYKFTNSLINNSFTALCSYVLRSATTGRLFGCSAGSNGFLFSPSGTNYRAFVKNTAVATILTGNAIVPGKKKTDVYVYTGNNSQTLYENGLVTATAALNGYIAETSANMTLGLDAGLANSTDAVIFCGAVWGRVLSNFEIAELSRNPYQILKSRKQFFPIAQVTNVQLLYPSSDISTGSWTPSTGTTLYGTLDETTYSDADYIQASSATTCEIKLSAGGDPLSSAGHVLKYRLLSGSGSIQAVLKCGSTTIATWNHTLTGSAQDISNTLSGTQADSITDYTDLRVVFTSS